MVCVLLLVDLCGLVLVFMLSRCWFLICVVYMLYYGFVWFVLCVFGVAVCYLLVGGGLKLWFIVFSWCCRLLL